MGDRGQCAARGAEQRYEQDEGGDSAAERLRRSGPN
jgi:hypothetical protein